MTNHVGHRLLGYVVRGDLHGRRQGFQVVGGLHGDSQAVVAVLGGRLAQRRDEAQFVQDRRAQGVDGAPDVGDGVAGALGEVG